MIYLKFNTLFQTNLIKNLLYFLNNKKNKIFICILIIFQLIIYFDLNFTT